MNYRSRERERIRSDLDNFYKDHCDHLESLWEDHISNGEWGSGADKIIITDCMFWEFVEKIRDEGGK